MIEFEIIISIIIIFITSCTFIITCLYFILKDKEEIKITQQELSILKNDLCSIEIQIKNLLKKEE